MNTRSFFKSLALMAAGAAVAPGIFIPKFEPVRWKKAELTQKMLSRFADELDADARKYFGKWQFITSRFHLVGDVFVPDNPEFENIPASNVHNGERITFINPHWSDA